VDFEARSKALAGIRKANSKDGGAVVSELVRAWPDERIKLFVTWRGLQLRKARPELVRGDYLPLECEGNRKANVIAFARVDGGSWTLCIVPRLTAEAWRGAVARPTGGVWPIADWWRDTFVQLPPGAPANWTAVFNNRDFDASATDGLRLDVSQLFEDFPVTVLVNRDVS
jgi:(1->4)-alpha-D-glucan 1-alpha-D-glucosylmutase